jgi:hypothetical protein
MAGISAGGDGGLAAVPIRQTIRLPLRQAPPPFLQKCLGQALKLIAAHLVPVVFKEKNLAPAQGCFE